MVEAKKGPNEAGPGARALAFHAPSPRYPGPDAEDKPRQLMRSSLGDAAPSLAPDRMVDPRRHPGLDRAAGAWLAGPLLAQGPRKPKIPPDPRVVSADPRWSGVARSPLSRTRGDLRPLAALRLLPPAAVSGTDHHHQRRRPAGDLGATARQGDDETAKPLKILMLGGSSLWGFGARDDHTIPSLIAQDSTSEVSASRSGTWRKSATSTRRR